MAEKEHPGATRPLMKVDGAGGGRYLKIGCYVAQSQSHEMSPLVGKTAGKTPGLVIAVNS
jgi:hypothetical protein